MHITRTIGKGISQIGERFFLHIFPPVISNTWARNRLVDRDMVMRYHWGTGVGHIYAHGDRGSKTTGSQEGSCTGKYSRQPPAAENANGGPQIPGDHDDGVGACGIEGTPNFPRGNANDRPTALNEDVVSEGGSADPPYGRGEHDCRSESQSDGGSGRWDGSDDEDLASEPGALSDEGPHLEEEDMDETYGPGRDDESDSGGVFSYD